MYPGKKEREMLPSSFINILFHINSTFASNYPSKFGKKTINCHSFHYHSYNERTLILMSFKNDLYFFPIASSLSLCFVFLPAKSSFSSSFLPFHPFFAPSCYRQLELFLVIHNKDFPLSSDLKLPPCYSFFFFLLNKIKI